MIDFSPAGDGHHADTDRDDPGADTDPDDPPSAPDAGTTDPAAGSDTGVPAEIPPPAPGRSPEERAARRRRVERLGDDIARLSAHIAAATARLLAMIRAFDAAEGWYDAGFRSCARWLSWRTGVGPGAAREKVRVARALGELPALSAALAAGELSYSVARAVTRVATPDNEAELVEVARHATAAEMERLVRTWRRSERCEDAALERDRARHAGRELWVTSTADGSWRVRGRLDPEVGAVLRKALQAAGEALYRGGAVDEEAAAEAKRADALGLVAEAALGEGLGAGRPEDADEAGAEPDEEAADVSAETGGGAEGREESRAGDDGVATEGAEAVGDVSAETRGDAGDRPEDPAADDAGADAASPAPAPVVGRAERFQVVVHVSAETLTGCRANCGNGGGQEADAGEGGGERPEERGRAGDRTMAAAGPAAPSAARTPAPLDPPAPGDPPHIQDGPVLPTEAVRRLACDAGLVLMAHDGDGHPLDVGRRTRSVPPALRRALDHRDGGCRFPGCGSRFCDAHHVVPWAQGGETRLDNLLLLCRHHHRRVHEDGWTVELDGEGEGTGGEVRFRRPDGRRMRRVPGRPAPPPDPVAALEREHEGREIDEWTPATSWDGVPMDVDWALYTLQEPLEPRERPEPGEPPEPL